MQIRNNGISFKSLCESESIRSFSIPNGDIYRYARPRLKEMAKDVDINLRGSSYWGKDPGLFCLPKPEESGNDTLHFSIESFEDPNEERKVRGDNPRGSVNVIGDLKLNNYVGLLEISGQDIIDRAEKLKDFHDRINNYKNVDIARYNAVKVLKDKGYSDSIKVDDGVVKLGTRALKDLQRAFENEEIKELIKDTGFVINPHFSEKGKCKDDAFEIIAYEKGTAFSEKSPHSKEYAYVHREDSLYLDILEAMRKAEKDKKYFGLKQNNIFNDESWKI